MSWGDVEAGEIVSGGGAKTLGQKFWTRDRVLPAMGATISRDGEIPHPANPNPGSGYGDIELGNAGGRLRLLFPDTLDGTTTFFMWCHVKNTAGATPSVEIRLNVNGVSGPVTTVPSMPTYTYEQAYLTHSIGITALAGTWVPVYIEARLFSGAGSGDLHVVLSKCDLNAGWILP